ncbi:MAG: peptidase T [Caldisericia bacterium]|nr:peptidase T [Caldisericia bacterium]
MKKVLERFLTFVKFDTQSKEGSETYPSTETQKIFAEYLKNELISIGMKDVEVDEYSYVFATLPSNVDKDIPPLGFMAHMDTAPNMSGKNVNPKVIENYDGKEIILNEKENIVLSPKYYPEILKYIGDDIVVTDGTTLLGADDKGGIAEIITAIEYMINHPEIKHGKIRICFTPDEEIGKGVEYLIPEKFGVKFAYTVDGGEVGELQFENFNAAKALIEINGIDIHPKEAKGKMKNSILIANELINILPPQERPEHTEGYEGFFHLISFEGKVEKTNLYFIIRDFFKDGFQKRKEFMKKIVDLLNFKYGEGTVNLTIEDTYYNMREIVEKHMELIEIAKKSMEEVGVTPKIIPIRGGTDGARLSYKGIPTPNIGVGGFNYHGRYEYIPVSSLEKVTEIIVKICENYTKFYNK